MFRTVAIYVVAAVGVIYHMPNANAERAVSPPLEQGELRGSKDFVDTANAFLKGDKPKIVNGLAAPNGAHPWQVSLAVSWIADAGKAHFCGGAVLDAKWILTAAHCVVDLEPKDIHVVVGTNFLRTTMSRLNVRRVLPHRSYGDPYEHDNDIALLELVGALRFSDRTKPISVASESEEGSVIAARQDVVVTGWGAIQEGGRPVRRLNYAKLPLVPREKCREPASYGESVTENMLCAGRAQSGTDSCQGDSGGPLTTDPSQGPARLLGIVSWGEGCARFGKYGVYTRLSRFDAWISSCIANPGTC